MKAIKTDCCPLLPVALRRAYGAPHGLNIASNLTTGAQMLTLRFRKARKGEPDHGGENANAVYAVCAHCPFCGAEVSEA